MFSNTARVNSFLLMGIDILIAAHPRSDMETLEKNYNGYKILNDDLLTYPVLMASYILL